MKPNDESETMEHERALKEKALGTRDDGAREPDSFALFLQRARAIGFTDAEIDRLRATYGHSELGIGDEHRHGGGSD